jgi:hypothetical protein
LPATAAVFCSCGAALYGTASTISALSTAGTPAPKIASWPLANVAHVWNCGTAELAPSGVENDNVASVHTAMRHDAWQTHATPVPPARAIKPHRNAQRTRSQQAAGCNRIGGMRLWDRTGLAHRSERSLLAPVCL